MRLDGRRRNAARHGKLWVHDEITVAMELYVRRESGLSDSDPEVQVLAELFERTPSAVIYKIGNIEWVATKGQRGWRNTSEMDAVVWKEFENRPSQLQTEARKIRMNPSWR